MAIGTYDCSASFNVRYHEGPVYERLGSQKYKYADLRSGVQKIEILPPARIQIREATSNADSMILSDIQLVKVTGITLNRDGKLEVWVLVGPTGDRHRLSEDDSFKLGDKEYKLVSVNEKKATFTGNGKTFVASPNFETRGAFIETNR